MGDRRQIDYEAALAAAGLRLTRQRHAILAILRRSPDWPEAGELLRRAREIDARVSLATVYRTLNCLEPARRAAALTARR